MTLRYILDAGCLPEPLPRSQPLWPMYKLSQTQFNSFLHSHPTSSLHCWCSGIIFYIWAVKSFPKGHPQRQDLSFRLFKLFAYGDPKVGQIQWLAQTSSWANVHAPRNVSIKEGSLLAPCHTAGEGQKPAFHRVTWSQARSSQLLQKAAKVRECSAGVYSYQVSWWVCERNARTPAGSHVLILSQE